MPVQTNKRKLHFPDGVNIAYSPDGATYYDWGALREGVSFALNFDKTEEEAGNIGKLSARAKNMTVALTPSDLLSWDLEAIQQSSGGLFNLENVAGTPVAGATQVISSGWVKNTFYSIENQNGDATVPTINSVTGSVDGALTVDTEYIVVKQGSEGWGIILLDAITTDAQNITIDYDYTPSAGKIMTAGTSSIILSRGWVRLRHYTDTALTTYDVEIFIYGVDMDAGISFALGGANSDTVDAITVALTGNLDTSLADGKQLLSVRIDNAALTDDC